MHTLTQFFRTLLSVENIVFTISSYEVSFIELTGTVLGLLAYIEIIRRRSHGLIISIVSCSTLLLLFYQIRLYADMLLMVYYITASAIALFFWQRSKHSNHSVLIRVTRLRIRTRIILTVLLPLCILLLAQITMHLNTLCPRFFPNQANFPLYDATTTVFGITASVLLIRRNVESMALWLLADFVSLTIYAMSGVLFLSGVYIIYTIVDLTGLITWLRQSRPTTSPQ